MPQICHSTGGQVLSNLYLLASTHTKRWKSLLSGTLVAIVLYTNLTAIQAMQVDENRCPVNLKVHNHDKTES